MNGSAGTFGANTQTAHAVDAHIESAGHPSHWPTTDFAAEERHAGGAACTHDARSIMEASWNVFCFEPISSSRRDATHRCSDCGDHGRADRELSPFHHRALTRIAWRSS